MSVKTVVLYFDCCTKHLNSFFVCMQFVTQEASAMDDIENDQVQVPSITL